MRVAVRLAPWPMALRLVSPHAIVRSYNIARNVRCVGISCIFDQSLDRCHENDLVHILCKYFAAQLNTSVSCRYFSRCYLCAVGAHALEDLWLSAPRFRSVRLSVGRELSVLLNGLNCSFSVVAAIADGSFCSAC
jgi:hypothetical protein